MVEELEWQTRRDRINKSWFTENPINIERLRIYQREAIQATESAIAKGKRALLLAMATGTGKTFLTVAQIYRLLESKAFRRILFLVDRRALAAQAVREFASFKAPKGNKFSQEYEVFSQKFRREDFEDDKPFDPGKKNGANEVIQTRVVSVGLMNKTQVHPREVFADPITDRASAVIVAHNHPAGGTSPSQEDRKVTQQLKAAGETLGIRLLDHIIFDQKGY